MSRPDSKEPAVLLRKGISALGIRYTEKEIAAFLTYLEELRKWNRAYNLTGLKRDEEIVVKHFLDSLLFLKVFPEGIRKVADIGSGAGFPGIPIKIVKPDLKLFLVEPARKKTIFLRHICAKLNLTDTDIIDARIEDIQGLKVDAAMTRALFSIEAFAGKAGGILRDRGVLILNKGPKVKEELKGLDPDRITVTDLELPFRKITRHLVVVTI
jgi:16S rRNA (guanine527-N7)-methyltransferase